MNVVTLPEPTAARPHESQHQPRLLVIEDDAINRNLMRRLFENEYDVVCASNGVNGLKRLSEGNIDVILLDVMMPGMSGFSVLEEIRATAETADLPVILISGLADDEHIVQGLQLGANDYLTKPINVHVARARLRTQVKLKRLLDEHKRTNAQLEQLSQLREHFFRIASHDLKNPLTNLNLAVQELSLYVPQNEDTTIIQHSIDVTLRQMQTLIEDFLDMAALENTALELSNSRINLKECLEQIVLQYERAANRKQIDLKVCDDVEGTVVADSNRLMQVIGNLVSNAIKFSPEGTTVSIWVRHSEDRVRIYVQDEGPGIPLDEQQLLFSEFVKGSSQPTGGETSTGLGLWIVNKLVTLLNGEIGIESEPGHGAIFWVELPAYVLNAA